ncbi:MAG TPA: DUF1206 domain-containing protein [Candidatus Dormibacteraeota bacterium]|nr:DUF1206 domain-containing protein [Candidatus Dormibacteraeota bacterium]
MANDAVPASGVIEAGTHHARALEIEPGLRVEMPGFVFHPVLMTLERFGLLVRGILYTLVGLIAIGAMIGASESVDLQGSLTLVLGNAYKVPIAIFAAAGLFGYSLWGVVRAFADPLERGGNWHGIISRIGFLWSAVAYGGLALFAIQYAIGTASGHPGSGLPFGINKLLGPQLTPWVLPVFGGVVLITGIGQFMDAWFAPFRSDFLPQEKSPRLWRVWVLAGRVGLLGRGVAFTLIGILMVLGGINGDLHYDYGLTRAFAVLLGLPAGAVGLTLVAIGFIALGLQSATSPPVLRMKPGLPPPVRRRKSKEA